MFDPEKVEFAVQALVDDYSRQSGYLSFADFARTVARRDLTADESESVRSRLAELDIVPAPFTTRPARPAETGGAGHPNLDIVSLLVRDMKRVPLLTPAEESALGQYISAYRAQQASEEPVSSAIEAGAREAIGNLVAANVRLVFKIAREYEAWSGVDLLDLIAEGCLGLTRAAEKYDHTLGWRFATYATHWIHQAMSRAVSEQGRVIRLPPKMFQEVQKYKRVVRTLSAEGPVPQLNEIALHLGVDQSRVIFLQQIAAEIASLDEPGPDEEMPPQIDNVVAAADYAPDHELLKADRREAIDSACNEFLTPRELDILRKRFGFDDADELTLREIGEELGLSRERIRQIEEGALAKLRRRGHGVLKLFLES